MMKLVDAHIHLPAYSNRDEVIEMAKSTGTSLVSCTVKVAEAEVNLKLRNEHPGTVSSFLGVHPSDASVELPSEGIGDLFSKADGIGEIGLDKSYSDASEGSLQMKAFLDQLAVAERLGKPVVVHSRGSEKVCLALLKTFRLKSVLMHWFEGEEDIQEVVSNGYFVSLGPAVLYSKRMRRIASAVHMEGLLTETDGPVAYKALQGANGPNLIPSVLFRLAEVRGVAFDDMANQVHDNLHRFLRAA